MIAIIDYDAGNLASVERALRYLGVSCVVTRDLRLIDSAHGIIFPGVGAAGSAMESLKKYGLDDAIKGAFAKGRPVLGICLGTQVILEKSEENQAVCLGLLDGEVRAFPRDMLENGETLKVPHMGWNNINILRPHPVLRDIRPEHQFYFVHSFYPAPLDTTVLGLTRYGFPFASVIGRDNLVATQFHPEKSGKPGLEILRRFCEWRP
jgi:glutamine amidotransferase